MPNKTNDKNETSNNTKKAINNTDIKIVKKETSSKTNKNEATLKTKTTNTHAKKNLLENNTKISTSNAKKKTSTNNKSTTKKASGKKSTSSTVKKTTKVSKSKNSRNSTPIIEYYDLPYRYNETVVKILAQTPKMLFVYWDISDKDREKYKQYYGKNFFTTSYPVLIIHNETMNYSFELEINDFANSWYIQVNDANCKYNVELGRKPNRYIATFKENYVYISSSNHLEAPNDHILFEKLTPHIKYKNVKSNQINIKDFSNSAFIKNILQIYSIKTIEELYEKLYEKELLEDFKNGYYKNPTSNPSSNFHQTTTI